MLIIPIPIGSTPTTVTPGVDMTGLDLVTQALLEIGVLAAGETPSGEDATYGLAKLNRLLDRWNANPRTAFATGYVDYTLTPNLSPHTIGPSGTFVVTDRPNQIDWASVIISNNVRLPITLRDRRWYETTRVPALASNIPTDLFYDSTMPNGTLWLWPVPNTAWGLELWTRGLLSALTLTTQISAPAGYRDAIVLTLAESLAAPFGVQPPPTLPSDAAEARAIIFGENDEIPRITSDFRGRSRGGFIYPTGQVR